MTSADALVLLPVAELTAPRLERLAGHGAFTVWFLAGDFRRYSDLGRSLPAGWAMPSPGPHLFDASKTLEEAVINLDAPAWPQGQDRKWWDCSALGERGPFASPLMLNLVRLFVFDQILQKPGNRLVVVDDNQFAQVLWDHARQRGAAPSWMTPGDKPGWRHHARMALAAMRDHAQAGRICASAVARFLQRKLQLHRLRRRHPLPVDQLRQAECLVAIWAKHNTFPADGPLLNDPSYGVFPGMVRQTGRRVAYLAFPLPYLAPFAQIARNALTAHETVVLVEDLVPWWAIFPALWGLLGFARRVGELRVGPLDATALLRREARREARLSSFLTAAVMERVGARLTTLGSRPATVVHLYEHQPWEKMLDRGLRRRLPGTRVIGLQHSPFARNYISFFPSRASLAAGVPPDLLLVMGEGYRDWFIRHGMPQERIQTIGAVRYQDIPTATTPGSGVLCCTGFNFDEAAELAYKAAVATRGLGQRLVVNFHPVTDDHFRQSLRALVERNAGPDLSHVEFSTDSVSTLLPTVDTVLYNSSASGIDAALAGRRAIHVGRDLVLDYDKLPETLSLRCRSPDELRALLTREVTRDAGAMDAEVPLWVGPLVSAERLAALLDGRAFSD